MPFQILEEQPTFAQKLTKGLPEAAAYGAQAIPQLMQQQKQAQSRNKFYQDLTGYDISGLSAEDQSKFAQQFMKNQESFAKRMQRSQETKEQEERLLKEQKVKEEQERAEWQGVFKDLREGLPYVGMPIGKAFAKNIPFSKAAKEREKFDVTAFQLERFARAAHTKGALSTKVYQSLLSKLPDSKLSEAKNLGRIEAWEKALIKAGLDPKEALQEEAQPIYARNRQTGERIVYQGGQWRPVQ